MSDNRAIAKALYDSRRWRRIKRIFLAMYPMCEMCQEKGLKVAAEVCHHLERHEGDRTKFFMSPLQSLCAACHDHVLTKKERQGYSDDIGPDGFPLDSDHPFYGNKKK